jgi:hypothetical protein
MNMLELIRHHLLEVEDDDDIDNEGSSSSNGGSVYINIHDDDNIQANATATRGSCQNSSSRITSQHNENEFTLENSSSSQYAQL